MRKITCTLLIVMLVMTAVLAAGCGGSGSSGSAAPKDQDIQVGEYKMKPEKWTKEGSDDGSQGLSFLIVGERIPVTMSLGGGGTSNAGFRVELIDGDARYSATQVSYNKIDDGGAYGIRAIFYFPDIPEELPSQAEVSLASGDQESAVADLTGIPEE